MLSHIKIKAKVDETGEPCASYPNPYLDEHLFDQESAQKPRQSLQSCLLTESAGRPRQCSEFL